MALGGGAARGLAHIGVLKVLEENAITVDFIAGTSVGSLVGGAYASGISIKELIELAHQIRWRDIGSLTLSRMGLSSNARLEEFIRARFPVTSFEQMRIPLAVVATDLATGRMVVFNEGDAALAIRASCAIPGIYTPVVDDKKRMLADGALVNNLPASIVRAMGADRVIAVDVNAHLQLFSPPSNVFQVLMQSISLMTRASERYLREDADLVVQPKIIDIKWDELERVDELIAAGEEAMKGALEQARQLLEKPRRGLLQRLRSAFAPGRAEKKEASLRMR